MRSHTTRVGTNTSHAVNHRISGRAGMSPTSTVANGPRNRIPRQQQRRCSGARLTGFSSRCSIWCRCSARRPASRSRRLISSATWPSCASTTCCRRSTTRRCGARCCPASTSWRLYRRSSGIRRNSAGRPLASSPPAVRWPTMPGSRCSRVRAAPTKSAVASPPQATGASGLQTCGCAAVAPG
ncbi:MAG: hypothetical protein QOH91_2117 [Mycobacterium sp.]|nr:hypothetical protein [Mycobacterium sp.]